MKIHFTNARIMPLSSSGAFLDSGDIVTENDRIIYVGEPLREDAPEAVGADRSIDCKGDILMPGFKNAHTHSAMTFLRSMADDLPLHEWLNKQVFPREAMLTEDDVYWLSKLAFLEYMTTGITSCFDMYFFPEAYTDAAIEYNFRTVLCGAINNFGGTVEGLHRDFERFNSKNPLVSYCLGFHAEYTCDEKMLKEVAELAAALKKPVFTHNSETRVEVDGCIERHGASPTVYLDSLGMFEYGGGGYHCVHFDKKDIDIFAKKGLYAVTNPGSNTKLASGIAPLTDMLEAGVHVALGTDGPASNNCLDFFREMFLATGLAKLKENDAAAMPWENILRMACVESADAMGLSQCNCLAPGKKADIIRIDMHRPNMQPVNNPGANIVYSGSKENVAMTMIDGRIVYERGEFFTGEDPEVVYAKANEIVRRITG